MALLRYFPNDEGGTTGPHRQRRGPVARATNGTPTRGAVDKDAVAELERLSELFRGEDGHEREVVEATQQLIRIFEHNEDYDHLVDALFLIGEAYYHRADWPQAELYMSQAAELGYRYFADEMSSYPLKVVGESQFEQGKEEEALATFRQRLHILRQENDVEELAGALFDVGGMLVNTERFDDALAMLDEARRVAGTQRLELERQGAQPGNGELEAVKVDEAEILYHIAIAHFRKGDMESAGKFLKRALAHFSAVDDSMREQVSDRVVSVLDDLVQVSETLEDYAAADMYRRQRDELNS